MILRRVIQHVKKQEWTAIAIDLVIVVLGVVIGIQVSNWNAARADRERAHGYLERIRDDLDADIVGYRDRLEFWGEVSASGARGLACSPPVDEARARAVVDAIRNDTALMRELRYWMSTMRVAGDVGRIYMGVAIGLRDAVDAKVGRQNPAP